MGPQFNRSFTLKANLTLDGPMASGVVMALGSRFAGWSLFLEEGRPVFQFARSILKRDTTRIAATTPLPAGTNDLELRFSTQGPGKPSRAEISSNGRVLASGEIEANLYVPQGFGEMLDAGRDTGVPVAEYKTPQGLIEGDISHVSIVFD